MLGAKTPTLSVLAGVLCCRTTAVACVLQPGFSAMSVLDTVIDTPAFNIFEYAVDGCLLLKGPVITLSGLELRSLVQDGKPR